MLSNLKKTANCFSISVMSTTKATLKEKKRKKMDYYRG